MGALALLFWHSGFRRLDSTGPYDWQFFIQMWETARVAIQRHGELPLWNPYQCGGVTLWGNPQSPQFSPFFPLAFVFGTELAMKLRLVALTCVGLMGMYTLARRVFSITSAGALLAAVAWACSGFFSWHVAVGHNPFQTFWLFPWIAYHVRRAEDDIRFSAAAAALIFFMVIDGATYPLPYLALFLGADALLRLLLGGRQQRRWRIVAALGWSGGLALLLSALRTVPSLSTLARLPRNLTDWDSISLADALLILTARRHEWRFDPHQYTWHEYGSFVGWTVLALGALGALLSARRYPALVAGALLFFLCMLGHVAPYFPWPLLKRLPVLESLRIPSRFVVLFTFHLALLAGLGLDGLRRWLDRLPARWPALRAAAAPAIVLLASVDIFAVNLRTNDSWRGRDLEKAAPRGRYHLLPPVRDFRVIYASFPQRDRGTAQCYEGLLWPVPAGLWNGDVAQARVSGEGRVTGWGHTTNTMWADVDLPAPARVVFNQTFAPGWRSSAGDVVGDEGRTAVDAAAGKYRLEVTYRPAEMTASLLAMLAGLVLTLLSARRATWTWLGALIQRLRRR